MNANYGLFPPINGPETGRGKRPKLAARALEDIERFSIEAGLRSGSSFSDRRRAQS
jgi:hypothetical protein